MPVQKCQTLSLAREELSEKQIQTTAERFSSTAKLTGRGGAEHLELMRRKQGGRRLHCDGFGGSGGPQLQLIHFLARVWTLTKVSEPAGLLNSVGRFFPASSKQRPSPLGFPSGGQRALVGAWTGVERLQMGRFLESVPGRRSEPGTK